MPITEGGGRGELNKDHYIKVLLNLEGVFVKAIAISRDKKAGIGILANQPYDSTGYTWGDFVYFKEEHPYQLLRITRKVNKIPNKIAWEIINKGKK